MFHSTQGEVMAARRRLAFTLILLAVALTLLLGQAGATTTQPAESPSGGNFASKLLTTDNWFGTGVIWFLVLVSFVLVSLVIQAFMRYRTPAFTPPQLRAELEQLLAARNYREAIDRVANDSSPFGQIMSAALNQASRGYAAMEQALEETTEVVVNQRIRKLVYMEIAGAAGPMMGLFGTVFGMITAFTKLVESGGAVKPGLLAGGIATALVCTFWGLVVGIPGVIFAALFRVRIEGLGAEAFYEGQKLINQFRPRAGAQDYYADPGVGWQRKFGFRSSPD